MVKRKKLPPKKYQGLFIYCSECKKYFSWTQKSTKTDNGKTKQIEPECGKEKVKYSNCKSFHKHKYKARYHIPGSNKNIVSKTFDTTKYDEAVEQAVAFKRDFKTEITTFNTAQNQTSISTYLFDAQITYLDFLDNIDVAEHEQKKRSEKHIKEQYTCLELFNEALTANFVNKKIIGLHKLTNKHVGHFHKYLLEEKEYSNKTYNNKMSAVKSFFTWAFRKYKINQPNPFENAKQRSTVTEKNTITEKEFKELIDHKNMCHENGEVAIGKKKAIKRNLYRDYLADGLALCLHTGGRREEVVELKWNMIHEINNEMAYIEYKNLKVERILGEGHNDNVSTNIIPITKSLKELLLKLGYNTNKSTTEYIICPERAKQSTLTIMDNLSKGFTHFYNLLNTGRELQMKSLRKTYLTHLNNTLNGEAKKLSSHTTDAVLEKHYIDKKVISKTIAEMTIFGD